MNATYYYSIESNPQVGILVLDLLIYQLVTQLYKTEYWKFCISEDK